MARRLVVFGVFLKKGTHQRRTGTPERVCCVKFKKMAIDWDKCQRSSSQRVIMIEL
jgi:hypothetical protein